MMRVTIVIDETLLEKARSVTGLSETNALVQEGLRAVIERESAR